MPRELEQYSGFWLVSERMKDVLEDVDPGVCAFVRCELILAGGNKGPAYRLCDVQRILDALDEVQSHVRVNRQGDHKWYSLSGFEVLVFKEAVIGDAHVFRMAYREIAVVCDDTLRNACKAAKLKGLHFRDALSGDR